MMCYNKTASRREMCQERDKVQDYLMHRGSILSKPSGQVGQNSRYENANTFPIPAQHFEP